MIQVAIIGAGFIGPAHLEALRRLGDVEVVALCDSRLEAAQRKARALNIAHAYDSVEALLAHPGAAGGANCTPNHLHAQINRQILAAGLHIFSEKPLCMTAEEAAGAGGACRPGRRGAWRQLRLPPVRYGPACGGDDPPWRGRQNLRGPRQLSAGLDAAGDRLQLAVDSAQGGASRTVADIGSHWCDTVQFMTGRRIVEVMAICLSSGQRVKRRSMAKRPSAPFTRRRHMKRALSIPRTLARCCCVLTMAAKAALWSLR
ncbi:Oxidoreductase [Klebsiella pneumoniae]|uniref:Oxidoreductase n=1 Tax=Klebsiella pneumoniae TaxID=573 RepID=A0A377TS89_KLEPN|nr:Oxidoreductase [Klebsiella pneumoniae]